MSKKLYIKGKDGKFKGSVPSADSVPSSGPTALPSMPGTVTPGQQASQLTLEELKAKWAASKPDPTHSEIMSDYFDRSLVKSYNIGVSDEGQHLEVPGVRGDVHLAGTINKQPEGYLATYSPGDTGEVNGVEETKLFEDSASASEWLRSKMTRSGNYILDFEARWESNQEDIYRAIDEHATKNDWNESWGNSKYDYWSGTLHSTLDSGHRDGVVVRNVAVWDSSYNRSDYYNSTFFITVEENGKTIMVSEKDSAEEALAFARYIGSGAADSEPPIFLQGRDRA